MFKHNLGLAALFVIVCSIIFLLTYIPLIAIWSVNTLFSMTIPYTLDTWMASTFLCVLFAGNRASTTKN